MATLAADPKSSGKPSGHTPCSGGNSFPVGQASLLNQPERDGAHLIANSEAFKQGLKVVQHQAGTRRLRESASAILIESSAGNKLFAGKVGWSP